MKFLPLIFILALSVSCKTKKESVASNPETGNQASTDSLFASFEKTPCFGLCPVFKLSILNDGTVYYEGRRNTDKMGVYKGIIPETRRKEIYQKALKIGFFEMKESYDGPVTDLPSVITIIQHPKNGRKKVLNRFQGPEEMKELEKLFDDIISSTDWTLHQSSEEN